MPQVCKGCGAYIKWVKMKTGGNMPVDIDEVKIVRIGDDLVGEVVGGYVSHFATCPKSDKFRKRDHRRFAKGGEIGK